MFWEQFNIKTHKQIALTSSQLINITVTIYCCKVPRVLRNLRGSPQDLFIIFPSHISPGFTLAYCTCSVLPQQTQALSPHLADSLALPPVIAISGFMQCYADSYHVEVPKPQRIPLIFSENNQEHQHCCSFFAFISLMSLLSYNPQS